MKDLVKKEKQILEIISDIYIFIMIVFFPLLVNKTGYFHILECKWHFYTIVTSVYVAINILVLLYYFIFKKVNYIKYVKFSIIQWLAIGFLFVNLISCVLSPFNNEYNLLIGVGRYEGLITMSLYILSFLCVSLFTKFKKSYLLYFSITSILLSLIAFLQYIGLNPFNIYQGGLHAYNSSFITTIGNVDFVSAIYCILLTVSVGSFILIDDDKKWKKATHILSILMGFFVIGLINVQSGKVAFLSTFIILLPFLVITNKRLSRLLVVVATILMSYCINIIINPVYHFGIDKLSINPQFSFTIFLFIIICSILVFLAYILYKVKYDFSDNHKLIKRFYIIIVCCCVFGLLVIYFVNFRSGILYEMHELMHGNFDDNFGTYRIFLWKRTIPLLQDYPILGTGPDSFAIRFMARYTNDIMAIGPLTINDTAANVYLTMMINLGLVGLLNYIVFLFFQLKRGIQKCNKYSFILFNAIVCYIIQDVFNLSLVIVTPIFWILMGLHFSSVNNE